MNRAFNQKWYFFKSARKKAHPINVGVYEEFTALDDALEWHETYDGAKVFLLTLKKHISQQDNP